MYYLPAADLFIQCSNYFSQVCSSRYFVFCRFCLGSLFSAVSFKIKYFKQVSVHLEIPISSVPAEFGCDTKMPLYCSWKYLCFKCIWLYDKKPSRFVAELCYSGWYMGCSVQFPIIFLGKNVMAWSHSQEQSKLVLESWRLMWMYSTTSIEEARWPARAGSSLLLQTVSALDSLLIVSFSLATLVAEALGFDTMGVSSCFKASLLCWRESFHKFSNSAAGDKDREAWMWKVSQKRTVSLWLLNLL